jgi:hypothetical protein
MEEKYYVYTMVRRDLSPEQRAVQACHASFELGLICQDSDMKNASLVLLSAPTEEFLRNAKEAIESFGIKVKAFHEPDIDNQMAAWACIVWEHERESFKPYETLKYNRGFMWHFIKFCKEIWKEWNNE